MIGHELPCVCGFDSDPLSSFLVTARPPGINLVRPSSCSFPENELPSSNLLSIIQSLFRQQSRSLPRQTPTTRSRRPTINTYPLPECTGDCSQLFLRATTIVRMPHCPHWLWTLRMPLLIHCRNSFVVHQSHPFPHLNATRHAEGLIHTMTVAYDLTHRGSTPQPGQGQALEDRFEVLKDIGDGSFGSVVLARVRGAGASVARRGTVVCISASVVSWVV